MTATAPLLPPPPPQVVDWPEPHRRDVWSRVTWGLDVKVLAVTQIVNPARRQRCRLDFLAFAQTYFPTIFYQPNLFHREFAGQLQDLLLAKAPMLLMKALAAPRGIGKTTVCLLFLLWAALYGHSRFALLLCDNADHAAERLDALKALVLGSDLLFEDFPEICGPVRNFGGDARAAAGEMPGFPWSRHEIRLANAAWLAAYGMDSGIAGRLKQFTRPDLLLVDDAETVDTVKSPAQTKALHDRLYQEVMKLPAQGGAALLVWICTLKLKGCISDQLTDPAQNPAWRGERYKALVKYPREELLWNHFMEQIKPNGRTVPAEIETGEKNHELSTTHVRSGKVGAMDPEAGVQVQPGIEGAGTDRGNESRDALHEDDPGRALPHLQNALPNGPADDLRKLNDPDVCTLLNFAPAAFEKLEEGHRRALRFYAEHKAEMDEGAVVLDPQRLPLHQIMYERAILGEKAWLCEVQQEPPKDENTKDLQLEIDLLIRRAVGLARGVVPAWAAHVLVALDLGRHKCYWQADAWDADFRSSCLIDQGSIETRLDEGSEYRMTDSEALRVVMVQTAIQHALDEAAQKFATGWPSEKTGEYVRPRAIGVDCGGTAEKFAWYETVLRFCAGRTQWLALKGSDWRERTADRALGRNWICEDKNNPGRRHDCNSDEYKSRVFHALAAPVWKVEGVEHFAGARFFHKDCPREYCRHLTAEKYVESIPKAEAPSGKEVKVGWNRLTNLPNHWWDTSWMTYAIADIVKFRGMQQARKAAVKYGIVGRTD